MDDPYVLRKTIQGVLPECIEQVVRMVNDPKIQPKERIHAFEALADRGGLPAVRATIQQNISSSAEADSLKERREKILGERDQLKLEIKNLRKVLPQPAKENGDATNEDGH